MPITRPPELITLEGVKQLKEAGRIFVCRYELVEVAANGNPRYQCVYIHPDGLEEVLINSRLKAKGPDVRIFNLWPGLFRHHSEYGDGKPLCFHDDFTITSDLQYKGKMLLKGIKESDESTITQLYRK